MTPLHLYHARRPYLPLLAAAVHLGHGQDSESFIAAGLRHDWRAEPLFVAGRDGNGSLVCCLTHGSRRYLYTRALDGLSGLFGVSLSRLDLDAAIASLEPVKRLQTALAAWLPSVCSQRQHTALEAMIGPLLKIADRRSPE